MKRSSIPNIYKPNYIEEKHITNLVNQYIISNNEKLYGKISVGKKGLERWRVKAKDYKAVVDQTRLYEVKQIFKKYQFDFKVKTNGFTKKYIDQFTDLLFIKDQKKYLPKRMQMIKENEVNYTTTLTDSSTPINSSDKIVNTNKNPFYITSFTNSHSNNKKRRNKKLLIVNTSTTAYKNIYNHSEMNENKDNGNKPIIINNDDIDNSDDDLFINPDDSDRTDSIAKNQRVIKGLNNEFHFHTIQSRHNKFRRMINNSQEGNQSIKKMYLPSVVNIGDRNEMSPIKKHFLHILQMRKSREKEDKLQYTERIPKTHIKLNPIKIIGSITKR